MSMAFRANFCFFCAGKRFAGTKKETASAVSFLFLYSAVSIGGFGFFLREREWERLRLLLGS